MRNLKRAPARASPSAAMARWSWRLPFGRSVPRPQTTSGRWPAMRRETSTPPPVPPHGSIASLPKARSVSSLPLPSSKCRRWWWIAGARSTRPHRPMDASTASFTAPPGLTGKPSPPLPPGRKSRRLTTSRWTQITAPAFTSTQRQNTSGPWLSMARDACT